MIRLLLAQPPGLLRAALSALLSKEDDLVVVAEVDHAAEVVGTAQNSQADVAVLHSHLSGAVSPYDLAAQLRRDAPDCRALLVLDLATGSVNRDDLAQFASSRGAVGYISAASRPADLIEGIRRMATGRPVLDAEVALAALSSNENPWTDRERAVLQLARNGVTAAEIARELHLSNGTVRNYLSRIITKTGTRTRMEAIRAAQNAGWL
jgi:two-component system response regulator DesR